MQEQVGIQVLDRSTGTATRLSALAYVPVWAPDSARLLIHRDGRWVRVIDAATGATLVHIADEWAEAPVGWTADGRSILYRRCAPDLPKNQAIACLESSPWIVSLDDPTHTARRYDGDVPAIGVPSPDGAWVAFAGYDGLYVAPVGGTGDRVVEVDLGSSSANEYVPSWSPDSAWLAFAWRGINLVPRTGGDARLAIPGALAPAWQPG